MNYDRRARGTYVLGILVGLVLVYLAIIATPDSMNWLLFALPGAGVFWWNVNKLVWSYLDPIIQRYRDRKGGR
ncbi:hypothetical protein VR010_11475 [Actinomycetaceae bacterium L2_0104]